MKTIIIGILGIILGYLILAFFELMLVFGGAFIGIYKTSKD